MLFKYYLQAKETLGMSLKQKTLVQNRLLLLKFQTI